ncbi:uncharacterized protein LOC133478672 [Phyllopteryx taeniolatus]|uniref:uncharacterized protein LOC133478672 n=1 Tax=Phyllopteryx taeniolatus TaxID=161469 RepID=UPI002AD5A51A|nr:uncharacterized protein LOC133478672 [Phyllopteryx taeniolatus]
MFKQAATYNSITNLQEYTKTVTAYISKSITVCQSEAVAGGGLQTTEGPRAAYSSGDEEGLRTARANLSCGIREAKREYSRKIAHRFSSDTRSLWRGIQTIMDYKPSRQNCESSTSLLNELHDFFARFEAHKSTPAHKTPPPPVDQVLTLTRDSVKRSLDWINTQKAPGPDNIPGRGLWDCAAELTDVFTDIFNTSLSQGVVPMCFKATTIIPVPKKSSPSCLDDYRPVALTPILMKCFARLVLPPLLLGPLPVCISVQPVNR